MGGRRIGGEVARVADHAPLQRGVLGWSDRGRMASWWAREWTRVDEASTRAGSEEGEGDAASMPRCRRIGAPRTYVSASLRPVGFVGSPVCCQGGFSGTLPPVPFVIRCEQSSGGETGAVGRVAQRDRARAGGNGSAAAPVHAVAGKPASGLTGRRAGTAA